MTPPETKGTVLASRLRLARERAGLSQGQIAKMMNLHRPTISEIEAGRRKVSAEELANFAQYYDVSITWLTDTEEETDAQKDRIELAARELAKLKREDLDKILDLLASLRQSNDD